MLKNKQSLRSLMSFMVIWSFLILIVTGIVLYVVPHGRVAYWVHWSMLGMEKEQWGWVHMMFGGVFILTGALANLQAADIVFASKRDSLEKVARANGITPMQVYATIKQNNLPKDQPQPTTAEEIEARFAGTGLGRQTLSELFVTIDIDPVVGMARLKRAGIEASEEETVREIADRYDASLIDLVQILLLGKSG